MKKFLLVGVFSLFIIFGSPHETLAMSIGVSPSGLSINVFKSTQRQAKLHISRDDIKGDLTFDILVVGIPLIYLAEGEKITIPSGQQSQEYNIIFDAENIDNGTYDGTITFNLEATKETNGISIIRGVSSKLIVKVLDRPDHLTTLSLVDYPSLISESNISNIDTLVDYNNDNNNLKINVTWDIYNNGQNPIQGIGPQVLIEHKGKTYFNATVPTTEAVLNGKFLNQSVNFERMDDFPSGQYMVKIVLGDRIFTRAFWVINPILKKQISFVVLGGVSMIGAVYFISRARTKRK